MKKSNKSYMSERGVVYVAWGDKFLDEMVRSVESVRKFDLPVCLITDRETVPPCSFDYVKRIDFDATIYGNAHKAAAFCHTPFEKTCYLDTDTVVLDELDFAFDTLSYHDICLAMAPKYSLDVPSGLNLETIMYNSGVIFFRITDRIVRVFNYWMEYQRYTEAVTDQRGLSIALVMQGVAPFTLPCNWNFRPHHIDRQECFYGPLKVWHCRRPVPDNIEEYHQDNVVDFARCLRQPERRSRIKYESKVEVPSVF